MSKISDLLADRPGFVWSVTSNQTVIDAIKLMAEKNIGAVCVIDEGQLKGIFSERDYARKIILQNRSSEETPVSEVMTADVVTITRDDNVETCMNLMTDNSFRHLPVLDGTSVAGMISIGDLVKAIIKEQKFTIEQLENYIAG